MIDAEHLKRVFKKLFSQGALNRIPKNPEHRDLILAVISMPLIRRYPYSEPELNELLAEELAGMHARVDHVTARRYLVDLGFLKRDAAGTRYYLNYLKQQEVLPAALGEVAQSIVRNAILNAPHARHRQSV